MTAIFDESCFTCIPDVVRAAYMDNWHATAITEGKCLYDFYIGQEVERQCYLNRKRYFTLEVTDIDKDSSFIYFTQNSVVE